MTWFTIKGGLEDFLSWIHNAWLSCLNSKWFVFILLVFIGLAVYLLFIFFRLGKKYFAKRFCISVYQINVFNANIKIDRSNIDIAYRIYTQLGTRKIGIAFDDNDVLIEVYDSWYSAFVKIRELLLELKPIPKNKDIIDIGNKILNKGMRPHLTRWQTKFRKWYLIELQNVENNKLTPQDIQRKYPLYNELVDDLKQSQREILELLVQLKEIFRFEKQSKSKKRENA